MKLKAQSSKVKALYTALLITTECVIPAEAGIQTSSLRKQGTSILSTGFRVKPGLTYCKTLVSSCIKRPFIILCLAVLYFLAWPSVWESQAACRNPNIAESGYVLIPAAASGAIEIKWFGHSFFQITSSTGTRIITDPFGPMGFPMPEVWPHMVTVGREHGNHNNVGLAKGNPVVLRGLKEGTEEWNQINLTFRDVLVYNVPVHQRGVPGYHSSLKGSAFVFEMDGLCILHSGDVSEPFNEDQLQLIGHVDVLLQTIGGVYTIGPEAAKQVIEQLKPKIVVPMHYWYHMGVLERFTDGPYRVRSLNANHFVINKDTLPVDTEIYVLKVLREGDL